MEQTLWRDLEELSGDVVDLKNKYKMYKKILCTTHGNKFENLDKIDKFHEGHKWSKVALEEFEIPNSSISLKEKFVIIFPHPNSPD